MKYIYGYLYANFKFEEGREDVIHFFEEILFQNLNCFQTTWFLDLLEILFNKPEERERFNAYLFGFAPQFKLAYPGELKYKVESIARIADLLRKAEIYETTEVWDLIMNDIKERKKCPYLKEIDLILRGLNFYYSHPESSRFQDKELSEVILKIKKWITDDYSDSYFYDVEEMRFLDFKELQSKREEINEKTHILEMPSEKFTKVLVRREELKKGASKEEILKEMKRLDKEGHSLMKIQVTIEEAHFGNPILNICIREFNEIKRKEALEKIISTGKIDSIFEAKKNEASGEGDKAAAAPGDKGKKDPKEGKKKK
eukprot:CAMPEP_0170518224 /NCGR_PEP_ID=MMETSP0209-20121228/3960_1 /TAXON_ID=665100 ORGANISM="Litonotus pictus, Strain P1" /NCGR_SAMPLE_ID=MMETSP0209 /ASSEMBLY_ACC=CAM_ASM_000301 /LENGTH=313 /DNA_ID=CAMNT_0010803697 /DNA_START=455 /DNA_END=1396 /DNA_ORIENTATION=-